MTPPSHLSPESQAWWDAVVADYSLEAHHLRLLQLAAEAFDQAQAARLALAEHGGLVVVDRAGSVKAHPCVAVLRDSRLAFARLLRELDLDCGAPAEARPPGLRSNRRAG